MRDDDLVVYQGTVIPDLQSISYIVSGVTVCEFQRLPVPFLDEVDYRFDVSVSPGGGGYEFGPNDLLQFPPVELCVLFCLSSGGSVCSFQDTCHS